MGTTATLPRSAMSEQPEATRWRRTAYRPQSGATHDPWTGLWARNAFEELLVQEFKRSSRRATVMAVIFLELRRCENSDFPEKTAAGAAKRLLAVTRPWDVVSRYGNTQFCVIAPDITVDGVDALAHRLRDELEAILADPAGGGNRPTAVAAIGCFPSSGSFHFEQLLDNLDQAIRECRNFNQLIVRSLLRPSDESTLRQIESRLFSRFLLDRRLVSPEQIGPAARQAQSPGYSIGRMARKLGWIGPRRLRRVLSEQRRLHEPFGKTAIRLGYLRSDQVHALLAIQRENPVDLARVLIATGALEPATAKCLLAEYARFLQARVLPASGVLTPEPVSA